MKTYEILYDSLLFPIKHFKQLLILSGLTVLPMLLFFLISLVFESYELNLIDYIVILFFIILTLGFLVQIIHSTIHDSEIKKLNWSKAPALHLECRGVFLTDKFEFAE